MNEAESLSPIDQVRNGFLKGREVLELLSQTGEYVFHGTTTKSEELHPRQAHNFNFESDTKEGVPDGEPAVFASDYPDIAIFMAMAKTGKSGRSGYSGNLRDGIVFKTSPGKIDENAKAYVYVFRKDSFSNRRGGEYISHSPVRPECVVEVTASDLPKGIQTIDEWK